MCYNGRMDKKPNAMAIFAYLWILIVIPFLTDAKKEPFVKYHLKQGLALLVFEAIGIFVGWFPILGWLVGGVIWLLSIIFAVIGIMNVLNGREKELPWIGQYARRFNF